MSAYISTTRSNQNQQQGLYSWSLYFPSYVRTLRNDGRVIL